MQQLFKRGKNKQNKLEKANSQTSAVLGRTGGAASVSTVGRSGVSAELHGPTGWLKGVLSVSVLLLARTCYDGLLK